VDNNRWEIGKSEESLPVIRGEPEMVKKSPAIADENAEWFREGYRNEAGRRRRY